MDPFDGLAIAGYLLALGAAVAAAVTVLRSPRFASSTSSLVVAGVCLLGGFQVAALATPDWNPLTMLLAFVPFVLIAVWMGVVTARRASVGSPHE